MLPRIHDTRCGFTFFDRLAVPDALWRARSTSFAFDVELLRLLRLLRDGGGRIDEIRRSPTYARGCALAGFFLAVESVLDDPRRD